MSIKSWSLQLCEQTFPAPRRSLLELLSGQPKHETSTAKRGFTVEVYRQLPERCQEGVTYHIIEVREESLEEDLAGFSSSNLGYINTMLQAAARRANAEFGEWQWELAKRVMRLQNDVLMEELVKAHPNASCISIDGGGICIN